MRSRIKSVGGLLVAVAIVGLTPSASFATPPTGGAPGTPSAVVAVSGNKSITVSWTESSSGSITFIATAQGSGSKSHSCTTKSLSCKIPSLSNGGVYAVTVVAKSKSATSSASTAVSVRVGVPGAPRAVRVMPGAATLSVAWSPPVASGASKLTSYMATASPGGFSCSTSGTILSQPPGRTCVITGLTPGTAYTVTVTATNAQGTGAPSAAVAGTPL